MQPKDKVRNAASELELCLGRGNCADGALETLRLAFEFEADHRDALRQSQDPLSDAEEPGAKAQRPPE